MKLFEGSERIRVLLSVLICLGCRGKSKNRDKQLTFIVRVSAWLVYFYSIFKIFCDCEDLVLFSLSYSEWKITFDNISFLKKSIIGL